MESYIGNLEGEFLADKECRVILSMGCKGSYKTTLMLNYIKAKYRDFHEFHLILPCYRYASDGEQYKFLDLPNVHVYSGYDEMVTKKVFDQAHKLKDKKIFYGIDDATSSGKDMMKDQTLLEIITTSRHLKLNLWMCLHAAKKIMSTAMRANIDYLFVHKMQNAKVFETIFEEFTSMKLQNMQQFKDIYNSQEKKLLLIDGVHEMIDPAVSQWSLFKGEMPSQISQKPAAKKSVAVKPAFGLKLF